MGSTDPDVFLLACVERALWEAECSGLPQLSLHGDIGRFYGDRTGQAAVNARAVPFLDLFGQGLPIPQLITQIRQAADKLGLGYVRTKAEALGPFPRPDSDNT